MRVCDTLLIAGVVVTQNSAREILKDCSVAISQGRIVAMGPAADMMAEWRARKTMDLSQMLLMPGLINSHTHGAMTFLRGLADDMPLLNWLEQKIFPVEARLEPEIVRLGSLLAYAEMLATGTTGCIDMYIFEDAVMEAAHMAGIRCMGGEAIFAFPSAACRNYGEGIRRTRELAEKYAGHERLKVAVNPHSIYTTTPDILAEVRALALELDLPVHIHLAETAGETGRSMELYGKRPVEYCVQSGLFDARVLAAHLVDINEAEAEALVEARVCAVHNPSSNMKLASGMAPVRMLLEAGVTVALGTDGPASNNQLNMFTEMGRAALMQKIACADPTVLDAQKTLDMATLHGAKAFGNDCLGQIAPGFLADCIALDLNQPNMQPLHNAVSQLVYAATGHECRMAMIGGEVVYEDGRHMRFDYDGLLREIGVLRDFVFKKKR